MSVQNWQNVGRPRIYVDLYTYLNAIGQIKQTLFQAQYLNGFGDQIPPNEGSSDTYPIISGDRTDQFQHPFGLDPWKHRIAPFTAGGATRCSYEYDFDQTPVSSSSEWIGTSNQDLVISPNKLSDYVDYVGILGNNLGGGNITGFNGGHFTMRPGFKYAYAETDNTSWIGYGRMLANASGFEDIHGSQNEHATVCDVSAKYGFGWNMFKINSFASNTYNWDGSQSWPHGFAVQLDVPRDEESNQVGDFQPSHYNVCSLTAGKVYDFPVSPSMKLRMTRDFDGIDTQTTRGGSTLTNIRYTGSPDWGNGKPPWMNYAGSLGAGAIRRVGRRSWSLSFEQVADDDLMAAYESLTSKPYGHADWGVAMTEDPYTTDPDGSIRYARQMARPILEDQSFYSQILMKTLGGSLPFIFQPDRTNASPDQFAICRIKRNSFRFSQKSHHRYNFKLDIVETW